MWRVRFVLSVCSLVMSRENLCVRFLNELLVVRLSFVVKLFIFVWNFRVEFRIRVFVSNFEFVFSFRCSIRFLEFLVEFRIRIFVSSFYSISRISRRISNSYFRFVVLFDFSNFSSKFSLSCSIRFLESHFEFVAEFDFSKLIVKFDFSNSRLFDSSFEFKSLEFRIRLDLFDFSNVDSNLPSKFEFEFVVEIADSKLTSLIYSRTYTRTSLSLPLERCARFSCVKY